MTQDELDRLPFAQLPRVPCAACWHPMVVYEVGQTKHPACDRYPARRKR